MRATAFSQDPFLERGLPCSIESERSILGAILLDATICNEAIELLKRDDFFLDSHRRIYDKMVALSGRSLPIDMVTLTDELRRSGEFEQIGGATFIASLIDGVPRTDSISYYAKTVKEKAMLRRLIRASNQIMARAIDADEEPQTIIDEAEHLIFEISEDRIKPGFQPAWKVAQKRLEQIEQMGARPEMITGVPTGFTDFDQMTAGLQKQDLIIIAGRPSMGKTALALNMALYAAKAGLTVGIFSLEMSAEQLVQRLLSAEGRVDAHRLRTGYLNREEWAKLADSLRRLTEANIFIDDSASLNTMEVRAKARRLQAEWGLDLLIVDYLQLMSGIGRMESRQQEVSRISREMKGIAKEIDIPIIALSQLSRAPERRSGSNRKPQLSDLRESGAIEQDADVVAFIYREEVYDETPENQGLAELIVGKQRNGPTDTAKLVFQKEFTRFDNLWRE